LATYLKDTALPHIYREMQQDESGRLADSQSLSQLFHDFGVNNRYLGQLHALIDKTLFPNLAFVVEKAIFVRCLKHVLREQMK
jgi:hypothetical protein